MLDPEGAHVSALRRLGEFRGQRILELGCGDGRLTVGIAADAARVLAFDFEDKERRLPRRAIPGLLATAESLVVR